MNRILLTGNGAAAWGARLARIDYLPAFPITPQTEIIETISAWIDQGEMECRMVTMDSEHSMITAAGAAAATGVRTFTATSSQGLLYGMEMLYAVAGWRVPLVLVNVSRALAAPVTLEPDHNDILAARDSGFLQIHCATCQEVVDTMLMAYRLSEDERVRLPVIVNLDGYYLSFTREPVEIPELDLVDRFLPPPTARADQVQASHPTSQGIAVLGGSQYSYFRYEHHLAALANMAIYEELGREYGELTGRTYNALELYHCENADIIFVMIGSFATKAKDAVDRLRNQGLRVGLVRPRLVRPFPADELAAALAGKEGVAVIDQNLSIGKGGILYQELSSALYNLTDRPKVLTSYVGGLGGRDISLEDFRGIADDLPLMQWLQEYIFPVEAKLTPEIVYHSTLLSICEMIKSGTTSFCDMYLFAKDVARAAEKSGMRSWIGEVLYDFPSPNYGELEQGFVYVDEMFSQYDNHPLVNITVDPHAVYTCSPDLLVRLKEKAVDHGSRYVIHLSETKGEVQGAIEQYGKSPVHHLEGLGLLDSSVLAAHCVEVSAEEIALLAERGVKVAHCPESNMKLASGVAPVTAMRSALIDIGLGTDGAASNNDVDMFGEMDSGAKLQKVHNLDPTALPASDVLDMATMGGARALAAGDMIGSLEVGKRADIIVLDLDQPHLTPLYNIPSHLVYAARGGDVVHSVIDGKVVMEDRCLLSLDEGQVLAHCRELAGELTGRTC